MYNSQQKAEHWMTRYRYGMSFDSVVKFVIGFIIWIGKFDEYH